MPAPNGKKAVDSIEMFIVYLKRPYLFSQSISRGTPLVILDNLKMYF